FLGRVPSRSSKAEYSTYVDPVVCVVLSVILLRKPIEILKESFADPGGRQPVRRDGEHRRGVGATVRGAVPPEGRPVGAGPQGRPAPVRHGLVPAASCRVAGLAAAGSPG